MPVIHIDTEGKFKEIYEFRDKIAKEWGLNLMIIKSDKINEFSPETDRFSCCTELKTRTLQKAIRDNKFDAIFVSIRRDEQEIRNKERYMSPRDKEFKWRTSKEKVDAETELEALQDTEMFGWDLYATDFGLCDHIRVHPLLHWTEKEVWGYVKQEKISFNPLYCADYVEKAYGLKNRRFRSLGCECCTTPVESKASTIDEIIEELEKTKEKERSGRTQDKEKIMEKLRCLGYL
jgi:sulfate adenylyltransferase subunit 2